MVLWNEVESYGKTLQIQQFSTKLMFEKKIRRVSLTSTWYSSRSWLHLRGYTRVHQNQKQSPVLIDSSFLLRSSQHLLKMARIDAQHNICIHLNEASIAVVGKSFISTFFGQGLIKPEVKRLVMDFDLGKRWK